MKKLKNWLVRFIITGSIVMFGYHLGKDFQLIPLRMYNYSNMSCIIAYYFWLALLGIGVVKFMKWIKNKLEEQEGWDNVDFSKARKGFNMLLLLDVGYILSFIGSNIVTGLDYDQLISIIVFIVLIAILYALRPNKKAKAGWIESKEKELTKATEKVKKGGDIDH